MLNVGEFPTFSLTSLLLATYPRLAGHVSTTQLSAQEAAEAERGGWPWTGSEQDEERCFFVTWDVGKPLFS